MSIRAQKGRQVFPRGGGVAFGAHWRCWVFPGGGGVAFGVRLGCWVFPGG